MSQSESNTYAGGVALIAWAAALWGFGFFLYKLLLEEISPLGLNFWKSLIVAIALLWVERHRLPLARDAVRRFPLRFTFLGVFGVALALTLTFLALKRLDLSITTALRRAEPIFALVLAGLLLRERLSRLQIAWILLALIGGVLLILPEPNRVQLSTLDLVGIGYALLGAAAMSVACVIGKSLLNQGVAPNTLAFLRIVIGTLILFPIVIYDYRDSLFIFRSFDVFAGVALVSFTTLTGLPLFYRGMRNVEAGVASTVELMTPLVSILLGVWLLGERLEFSQICGGTILLLSVSLLGRSGSRRSSR